MASRFQGNNWEIYFWYVILFNTFIKCSFKDKMLVKNILNPQLNLK